MISMKAKLGSKKNVPAVPISIARPMVTSTVFCRFIPLAVFVIAALAFAPVLQNDFVNWDDRVNILENRSYRGLSWKHLQWMFTTFHNSLYRPLTWITLGADYSLWGMNPSGYHLTSLVLHCAAAILFYYLSVQLLTLAASSRAKPDRAIDFAAGFAALIFAIHPLRVEPIAWVSGRENVVAGPFFILTLICYLRAIEIRERSASYWKWLVGAWLAYALSLLGKGAGVTLPIALLVLDVYPLRRLSGGVKNCLTTETARIFLEKVPFFVLALAAGLLAIYGKQQSKLMYGLEEYGITDRVVQTVYGLVFYLWKTLLPIHLSNLYEIETLSPLDWRFIFSAVLLVMITAVLWSYRRRFSWALAGWVYYCVILLPYVGVAQNGPQIAADRYSYLACLPWALLAGAALLYSYRAWQAGRLNASMFFLARATAVGVVLALGLISWRQSQLWRDSATLWRHALAINEKSFFAHHFLGSALLADGRTAEAIGHFQRSLALNPRYASAHVGLANALAEQNQLEKSIQAYQTALTLDPDSMEVHYGFARVLAKIGNAEGAIEHYSRALALAPNDPDTHNNLGLLLAGRGENDQAIAHFQAALRIDRGYAKAHYNLGRMLVRQGRLEEGIEHFRQALALQAGVAEIHENLGRALVLQGKIEEGRIQLEEAVRILSTRRPAASR
jgi:protein O-mannosyl-transferase